MAGEQAQVSVRLEENGKAVTGRGADTDTLVASARAYVAALNKLAIQRGLRRNLATPSALTSQLERRQNGEFDRALRLSILGRFSFLFAGRAYKVRRVIMVLARACSPAPGRSS